MTIYMEFTEAQAKFLQMTLNENTQIKSAIFEGLAPFGKTLMQEVQFIIGVETVGIGYREGIDGVNEVVRHEDLGHTHPE